MQPVSSATKHCCAKIIAKAQTKVSSSVFGKHQEELRLKQPVSKALIAKVKSPKMQCF